MLKINTAGGKFDITLSEDTYKPVEKSKVQYGSKSGTSRHPPQQSKQQRSLSKGPQVLGKPGVREAKSRTGKSPTKGNLGNSYDVQGRSSRSRLAKNTSKISKSTAVAADAGYLSEEQLARIISYTQEALHAKAGEPDRSVMPQTFSTTMGSKTVQQGEEGQKEEALMNSGSGWKAAHTNIPVNSKGSSHSEINTSVSQEQWKRDLAEQVALKQQRLAQEVLKAKSEKYEEYNPWGRPGAGAPLRTQSGNVVADLSKMNQNTSTFNNADIQESTFKSAVSQSGQSGRSTHQLSRTAEAASVSNTMSNVETSVPVALRSSFAVGAPGLVVNETQNKSQNTKKWREELDMQIQEKQERKLREKNTLEDVLDNSWGRPRDSYRSPPRPGPPDVARHTEVPTTQSSVISAQNGIPNLHGMAEDSSSKLPNRHARGHGMQSLALQSEEEMERKRAKMLEHQRAIQEQVEEKRRKKREEQDEKWKEEAAAEAKLAQQRIVIQQQFEEDQRKKKEKEEESKRHSEALRLSVLQAYEAAQQAKNEKRLKHLQAAGHNVSGIKSRMEASSAYLLQEEPRPVVTTALNSSVDQKEESPRHDIFTSRTDTDGSVRTSYDEHTLYKVSPESRSSDVGTAELERSTSPARSPIQRNKQKRKPQKKIAAVLGQQKNGSVSRTVTSHSEEEIKNKNAKLQRSRQPRTKGDMTNQHGTPSLHEEAVIGRHSDYSPPPQSHLVQAFMVPYHRTTSATLHQRPDSPCRENEASHTHLHRAEPKSSFDVAVKSESHPTGLRPLYRTESVTLKESGKSKPSPRHQKPVPKANKNQQRGAKSGSQSVNGSLPSKANASFPHRANQKHPKRKSDAVHTASIVQDIEEVPPTSRQEMILQQLATLRQGLMIKERELQEGVL